MDETLVQKLVEDGKGTTLFKLLEWECSISPLGGEPPEYLEHFNNLKDASDTEWPGVINLDSGLSTLYEDNITKGKDTVPDNVLEAYARRRVYQHKHGM